MDNADYTQNMNEIDLEQTEVIEPPRSQSEPDHLEFEVPEDGKPRCSSLSTLTRIPSEDLFMTQVLGLGVGNGDVLPENQVIFIIMNHQLTPYFTLQSLEVCFIL